MTDRELLYRQITKLVAMHGSLRAAARVLRVDPGYLSRLRSGGKTMPGKTLLRRLGVRAITTYERIAP